MSVNRRTVVLAVGILAATAALAAGDPVDRWATAVGGRDKVEPIRAVYREATIQVGPYEGWIKAWHTSDGRYRKEEEIGPYATVEVFDGTSCTVQRGATPPRRLVDAELARARSSAYANWNAVFFAFFPERRRGSLVVEADGTLVLRPEGGIDWRVSLDPHTALPKTMIHQEGDKTVTVDFVAYEIVRGLKFEREIHRANGDPRFDAVIRFTKTEINPTIDPSLFTVEPKGAQRAPGSAGPTR
jgi:hypothetical protein